MAATIHISEEEAARDFVMLVDRALAGEEIVVQRGNEDVVTLAPVRQTKTPGRTLGEVIALLKQRREKQGLGVVDDEFASDMAAVHEQLNRPLDGSSWD